MKGKVYNAQVCADCTITYCLCFYLQQVHISKQAQPLTNNPAVFGKGESYHNPKFSTEGVNHLAL